VPLERRGIVRDHCPKQLSKTSSKHLNWEQTLEACSVFHAYSFFDDEVKNLPTRDKQEEDPLECLAASIVPFTTERLTVPTP
jgi:hypothetical protein